MTTWHRRSRTHAPSQSREVVQAGGKLVSPGDVTRIRAEALVKLRGWFVDWSETAHAVFSRRADLITFGLAKRQKREKSKKPNGNGDGTPVTTPTDPCVASPS